jgi:4-hydroxy-3-polyprenylbenzoate decarboxylase
VDIIRNAWSSALDPRISPQDKLRGVTSHSKMIINACKPFSWKDDFPACSSLSIAEAFEIESKWGAVIG